MLLSFVFTLMLTAGAVFGLAAGRSAELGTAVMDGAAAAVQMTLTMGGMVCLWSGIMEVMRRSGLAGMLAGALRPLLRRLFPVAGKDPETMAALAENMSANLLGLGNAATPAGVRASRLMYDGSGSASDELCRLIVLNTASIQLIPSTLAGVRAAAGAAQPFDILPAVWLTSVMSAAAGLIAAKLLAPLTR